MVFNNFYITRTTLITGLVNKTEKKLLFNQLINMSLSKHMKYSSILLHIYPIILY